MTAKNKKGYHIIDDSAGNKVWIDFQYIIDWNDSK